MLLLYCSSFKILIKSSTFTNDYEYYLRHVCVHTSIEKKNVKYIFQAQINREKEVLLFGHFILIED